MSDRNLTITLPDRLVKEAKLAAAHRDTSVSALIRGYLEELVSGDAEAEAARQRFIVRARQGWDLGTGGQSASTRDELHDRRL